MVEGGLDGDVNEAGMKWTRNGKKMPQQSPHINKPGKDYYCGRAFHGTYNPDHDGDSITYSDVFSFKVRIGSVTGKGKITISGSFTTLGCQNRIACGP